MNKSFRIILPNACFEVIVNNRKIVKSTSAGKFYVGWGIERLNKYVSQKGGAIYRVAKGQDKSLY